jgi:hypothetical protein
MVNDGWDWDRDDCEPIDLDGDYATGDPQIDQLGYNSPRRRGENLTGFTDNGGELRARLRAQAERERAAREQRRREAVAQNLAETRQRVTQRQQPDRLAPHVEQAVERGAPGRAAGWYRVDVAADGSAQWSKVDAPGDGHPWITAHTPAPQPPQWQPVPRPARQRWWQRRRPAEPQPSPGTRIW